MIQDTFFTRLLLNPQAHLVNLLFPQWAMRRGFTGEALHLIVGALLVFVPIGWIALHFNFGDLMGDERHVANFVRMMQYLVFTALGIVLVFRLAILAFHRLPDLYDVIVPTLLMSLLPFAVPYAIIACQIFDPDTARAALMRPSSTMITTLAMGYVFHLMVWFRILWMLREFKHGQVLAA